MTKNPYGQRQYFKQCDIHQQDMDLEQSTETNKKDTERINNMKKKMNAFKVKKLNTLSNANI